MDIREQVVESFRTLTVNKLRTGLAILGIVIGIGSVIALISLGQGSQQMVQNQIQSLGANLLTVQPGFSQSGSVRGAAGGGTTLTLDDALALSTDPTITTVKNVSPEVSSRQQVTAGRNNANEQVYGVYPAYADIHKITLSSGSFVTTSDLAAQRKVAVIGPQVVTDLFATDANPVGQKIRVKGQEYTVIGVTASKGGTGFQNQDAIIYIPLSTAQKSITGSSSINSISVEAASQDVMTTAEDQVGYALLKRHKIADPTQADFSIFSQQDILNTASSVTGTFTSLLSGIAAISLLVGGIGIMNIMLVTVTERTREIGLRKALGAKRATIIRQFLIESIILTILGGCIGMAFGATVSFILSKVLSIPFTITMSSVLLSIGVSGGIGIIFGWYPARTAAKLQPIEALRYE